MRNLTKLTCSHLVFNQIKKKKKKFLILLSLSLSLSKRVSKEVTSRVLGAEERWGGEGM